MLLEAEVMVGAANPADDDAPPPAERPSPRPALERVDRYFALAAAALGAAGFAACWLVLDWLTSIAFYGSLVISDLGVYQRIGDAALDGQLPYRDFPVVYPPGALPVFTIASLIAGGAETVAEGYRQAFQWMLLITGGLLTATVAMGAWVMGWSRSRISVAAGFVAISPLLLGPVILSRYDLWPALLLAGSLALVASERYRPAAALLGLAIGAKMFPIVVVPVMVILVWRRRGPREVVVAGTFLATSLAAVFLPFAILAADGLLATMRSELERPLQVESLAAAILFVGHGLAGLPLTVETSHGSQNLVGQLPDILKLVSGLLQVGTLLAIWAWFARGSADPRRMAAASAASVAALIAFDSTISPQYMIWLIPVVPFVAGRRGVVALATLGLALVLTASYFPANYFDLVRDFDQGVAWRLLLRDLLLVVLVAVPILPWSRLRARWQALWAAIRMSPRAAALIPSAGTAFGLVLVGSLLLRALWLHLPSGSLIFDEAYYVNAARVMVGIVPPPDAHFAAAPLFLDPNTEHPPLGKALIGASIVLLGDGGLGWRLPSLIAGMVSLVALHGIMVALGARPWTAVLGATLYSLDVLSFIHGRIGTLDMLSLAFLLAAVWVIVQGRWALVGPAIAGGLLALGTLVKLPGVYGLAAVLVWQGWGLWKSRQPDGVLRARDLLPTVTLLATFAIAFLGGLWLLDLRFTEFADPVAHLRRMLGYGFALQGSYNPSGIQSAPWDWLINGGGFDYLKVAVNTLVDGVVTGSRATVRFHALVNPVLIGTGGLAVLYAGWLARRRRDRVAGWALLWMAMNWLPYLFLELFTNRIQYFYYILPAIPGLAAITATMLVRARLPRPVIAGYVALNAVAFIAWFPFREFPA